MHLRSVIMSVILFAYKTSIIKCATIDLATLNSGRLPGTPSCPTKCTPLIYLVDSFLNAPESEMLLNLVG